MPNVGFIKRTADVNNFKLNLQAVEKSQFLGRIKKHIYCHLITGTNEVAC